LVVVVEVLAAVHLQPLVVQEVQVEAEMVVQETE
jgi:hypothetical protein